VIFPERGVSKREASGKRREGGMEGRRAEGRVGGKENREKELSRLPYKFSESPGASTFGGTTCGRSLDRERCKHTLGIAGK
jgi:hypothetical protein